MPGGCLTGFFVINCMVLIIVVLLQSGKAADLAGAFGGAGSQTAFGPRGAANVLSKATTWCAVMFMLCAMALVLRTDRAVEQGGSVLQKFSQPAKPAPAAKAACHSSKFDSSVGGPASYSSASCASATGKTASSGTDYSQEALAVKSQFRAVRT